jgi:hypothetical protein
MRAACGISGLDSLNESFFYLIGGLALALVEFEHGLATLFQSIGFGNSELPATAQAAGEMLEVVKTLIRYKAHGSHCYCCCPIAGKYVQPWKELKIEFFHVMINYIYRSLFCTVQAAKVSHNDE